MPVNNNANNNLKLPTDTFNDYYLNNQATKFKSYGRDANVGRGTERLDIEDPTYLVFDLNVYNVTHGDCSAFFDSSNLIHTTTPILTGIGTYTDVTINSIYDIPPGARGKGIINFYNNYHNLDDEIAQAGYAYTEFIRIFNIIFPGVLNKIDDNPINGSKRHYINSISGLEVLNKKILDFPNDKLTLTLSEDITMLSQYLSELYLDLSYSYASNRQLVPSNLLRFDMYLTISDLRDMKLGSETSFNSILNKNSNTGRPKIAENKSKFIYVLHDCELDFSHSKIHGGEIITGGFSTSPTTTPATMNIDIIFKSYSRILSPALMINSSIKTPYILDYRLKGNSLLTNTSSIPTLTPATNYSEFYNRFDKDYRTQVEYDEMVKKYPTSDREQPIIPNTSAPKITDSLLSSLKKAVNDQKRNLTSGLKTQVELLTENVQKGISSAFGVNMTLTKINVYYDTPAEKIDSLSMLVSNLVNKTANAAQKTVQNSFKELNRSLKTGESYKTKNLNAEENFNSVLGKDALLGDLSSLIGGRKSFGLFPDVLENENRYDNSIINSDNASLDKNNIFYKGEPTITHNQKFPTDKITNVNINKLENGNPTIGDTGDLEPKGTYNKKYPSGDLESKGKYNKKYPTDKITNASITKLENGNPTIGNTGDLEPKGVYNKKYPTGTREDKGTYNEKYPEGTREEVGKYNEKYPEGDRELKGQYNTKYPNGTREEKGSYNEKYPEGDREVKGTYNEKYPTGTREDKGTYNEKYPDGTREEKGIYNEKYPDGTREDKGTYNVKYPDGTREEGGSYNEKYPDGTREDKGTYNEKYPEGDREASSTYNTKYPEGDRTVKGTYNVKYPDGTREERGTYNEKYPNGVREEQGTYNEKYPEGSLEEKGTYNQKFPDGDLEPDGQYNLKFPDDENVYLKNRK